MKTSVSLPDELFHAAEACARRLRVSRNEYYAKAIAEFLRDDSAVTARLNEIYSRLPAELDAALQRAQMKSLPKEDW